MTMDAQRRMQVSRSWSSFWHDFCNLQPTQGSARAGGVSQVLVAEGDAAVHCTIRFFNVSRVG